MDGNFIRHNKNRLNMRHIDKTTYKSYFILWENQDSIKFVTHDKYFDEVNCNELDLIDLTRLY